MKPILLLLFSLFSVSLFASYEQDRWDPPLKCLGLSIAMEKSLISGPLAGVESVTVLVEPLKQLRLGNGQVSLSTFPMLPEICRRVPLVLKKMQTESMSFHKYSVMGMLPEYTQRIILDPKHFQEKKIVSFYVTDNNMPLDLCLIFMLTLKEPVFKKLKILSGDYPMDEYERNAVFLRKSVILPKRMLILHTLPTTDNVSILVGIKNPKEEDPFNLEFIYTLSDNL